MSLTLYGISSSRASRPQRAAPDLELPCDLVPDHATGPEAEAGTCRGAGPARSEGGLT